MTGKILLRFLAALALASLLGACTQKNTGDDQAKSAAASAPVALGVDRFLLFPNPIGTDPFAQNGGAFETMDPEYAAAYYRAIDPGNGKDTIEKWKSANLFGTTGNGTEHLVVFRDVKDLGYGRRMTARRNTSTDPKINGSVAFYVENYKVTTGAGLDYSSELNVEAAIRRDTQWHVGTNAIEWSTACTPAQVAAEGCDPTVKFAQFYNFSSADGTRQLAVDLDGRGQKAMPGPCIACHGGRGDPLTPPDATGKPRFPLVENLPSRKRGDVGAHLHGQNVDSFTYSTSQPGFSKTDQQRFLTDFNQWILCTYPSATPGTNVIASPGGTAWGGCTRPTAGANEWQGTAGPMIEYWYGLGDFAERCDLPGQRCYVPSGWDSVTPIPGTTFAPMDLYKNVVAPYCRTCHILRGTKNQDDLDFMTFAKFQSYADRIKAHVFDRGNMPLSLIPHTDFWNSTAPQMLANFIDAQSGGAHVATSASGAVLMPGRPIANPGPDRMVRTGAQAILSAEDSLFASTFEWSQPSPSSNVTITNPTGMIAFFQASVAGSYVVRLAVNGGADFKEVTITADDNFPDPLNLRFAHVKNVLQNVQHVTSQASNRCTDCHVSPGSNPIPPVFYDNFDRDGDPTTDDDNWFRKALQGRVNLTEIDASPLLRKPTGNHHKGVMLLDVNDKSSGGGLSNYSILYNWILAGMPGGGVAASALVNNGVLGTVASPVLFPFTGPVNGPYASPAITLNGSASIGATSYAWTVIGPPGPLGTVPSILNSNSPNATLTVFNTGTYVVQLQVSDGVSTDTVQRTLVVGENPISASFTPATGSSPVTFSAPPSRGSITLTNTSSGNPTKCRWQIFGPAGATLGTFPTIVLEVTQLCTSPATLSVPAAAQGSTYTVQLTSSSLASSVADNFIIVAAAAGQNVSNANFTFPASSIGFTINNVPLSTPSPSISSVPLSGSATGAGPLTFSWSLPAGGGSAGCGTPAAGQNTSLPVTRAGTCDVLLTVSNFLPGVSTRLLTVTVSSTVVFSQVSAILGNGGTASPGVNAGCTSCHNGVNATPSWQNDAGLFGRLTTTTGTVVINPGAPQSSLLLICPTFGNAGANSNPACMSGNRTGFGAGGSFVNYDAFLTWIMNGTPQ